MASWSEFENQDPVFAARVRAVFDSHLHKVIATIRRDGSPRVSGTEMRIGRGEVWIGSMPGARKLDDLLRDPRLAIHGATIDQALVEGDAKLAGAAVATESNRYVEATGQPVPAGSAVFTVDLDLVVLTRVDGDELVIDRWTPRGGHRLVSRT